MKQFFKKFILAGMLMMLSLGGAFAQGKIYTRKAKLADFPTKTTKIIVGDNSLFEIALREDITARWRISPYEFSTPEEYERLKSDNNYYFLYLGEQDGLNYIIVEKGGKQDNNNGFNTPFEVVRMPFAASGNPSGNDSVYMGAFIDIIQNFVNEAMNSDKIAYDGLARLANEQLKGKDIYLSPELSEQAYLESKNDSAVGLVIAPMIPDKNSHCYKMLIGTDSHELLYFKKVRFKKEEDRQFTKSEIKSFEKKHGNIVR